MSRNILETVGQACARAACLTIALGIGIMPIAHAQSMFLSVSSDDFQVTPVFSNVPDFDIDIEIDAPLAPGIYVNPDIVSVVYSVTGSLTAGTPSGFPSFALQRTIAGADFYTQGSSLSFEIGPNAVLDDGVQVAELIGSGIVFTFNGREVGNGRFHPALLELAADGTGRIQNSDNVIVENPLQQVDFGDEYITDLMFDPGNTTLLSADRVIDPPNRGGGAASPQELGLLTLMALFVVSRSRRTNKDPDPDCRQQ